MYKYNLTKNVFMTWNRSYTALVDRLKNHTHTHQNLQTSAAPPLLPPPLRRSRSRSRSPPRRSRSRSPDPGIQKQLCRNVDIKYEANICLEKNVTKYEYKKFDRIHQIISIFFKVDKFVKLVNFVKLIKFDQHLSKLEEQTMKHIKIRVEFCRRTLQAPFFRPQL